MMHREGSRNRQPMVDRAWSQDLAAGGGSGQTMSTYNPSKSPICKLLKDMTSHSSVKPQGRSAYIDCEGTEVMKIQCPDSNSQNFSYGATYGVRNPVARPPGAAPAHGKLPLSPFDPYELRANFTLPVDGYNPGENHRLLYNQFRRDVINIKWRGHQ
ncbi:hypothetical protein D0867_02093 [Hortaea werneckii]|uniref:Uncharacterized protein n=1 Tax=Hortaea werneckii TaxID=91943 RepID=A0A3M7A7X6_HORWE|nr:hypothetical protein D0867_02093 [Hortaea werneckii]